MCMVSLCSHITSHCKGFANHCKYNTIKRKKENSENHCVESIVARMFTENISEHHYMAATVYSYSLHKLQ